MAKIFEQQTPINISEFEIKEFLKLGTNETQFLLFISTILDENNLFVLSKELKNHLKTIFNKNSLSNFIKADLIQCVENNIYTINQKYFNSKAEGYIYILKHVFENKELYKLGYTNNLKSRLSNYKTSNPSIVFIKSFYLKDAKDFEKSFHKNNCSVYRNEWYDFDTIKHLLD